MNFSLNSISVPLIAPSVNLPTEQVARENRIKKPVTPTTKMSKTTSEKAIKGDDKQHKRDSWEPSDHPGYDVMEEKKETKPHIGTLYDIDDNLARLARLLSIDTYAQGQETGYTMRFNLPKELLDKLAEMGRMVRRRSVISFHYDKAVVPNNPSDILAVL
ncbi:ATP-dependent Lon protease [uncultured Aliivibrio sp.]|uniref:ATP-dependent Lon protease n=1 Tax=uncultured Aliivibrio sp. TaxID=873085 RepID=UPI0026093087|nr:ATP-dependent Lon protease [uncultured Aliivibrio sp.]